MAQLFIKKGDYAVTSQDILDTLALLTGSTTDLVIAGNISWKSGTAFLGTLDHANTGDRIYTFPNASGTIAVLSNPQTWSGVQQFNTLTLKAVDIIFTTAGPKIIGGTTLQMINAAGNFFKVTIGTNDRIIAGTNVSINLNNAGELFQILNNNSFERIRYEYDNDDFSPLDNIASLGKTGRRWVDVWAVNGTIQTSFSKFKTNIQAQDCADCMDLCKKLEPITFQWKAESFSEMADEKVKEHQEKVHFGFNADPLITDLPEAVAGEDGVYQSSIIALSIGAIRNLDSRLVKLETNA